MDSTGKFSLGNKLVWDGSTLTVTGFINITSGTGFRLLLLVVVFGTSVSASIG